MTPNLVPFLNLHYIYCVIYSWFGGRCTTLGSSALDAARAARESLNGIEIPSVNGVGSTTRALVPQVNTSWLDWLNPLSYGMSEGTSGSGGFWSWLNPFSTSAGAATDVAAPAAHASLWGGLYDSLPTWGQYGADVVGNIFYYTWLAFSYTSWLVAGLAFSFIITALAILIMYRMRSLESRSVYTYESTHERPQRTRWTQILALALEPQPRSWREAILSADELVIGELRTRGYHGNTNTEILRSVPEDAFISLNSLWEAHRVSNFVREQSGEFVLTGREAFRVVKLYEEFLEEFRLI